MKTICLNLCGENCVISGSQSQIEMTDVWSIPSRFDYLSSEPRRSNFVQQPEITGNIKEGNWNTINKENIKYFNAINPLSSKLHN